MAMQPFRVHTGSVAALWRQNIDTDQIIPKQFLKRIERTGFGQFLFYDWRFDGGGKPIADFVLNQERTRGASILVAGRNFGCGSSREHAPWALADYGFRAIIAPSFADIFHNNSLKNGLLVVALPDETVERIVQRAESDPDYRVTIDLESCKVTDTQGLSASFAIEPFARRCLLEGLDDIGLTLQHEPEISSYESTQPPWLVRTSGP
jgi:3-isopropylmalate/(R)-2-methylmalate dehydratase small subunit